MSIQDERARAAFGHSLATEEWAVKANELAWKARRSRLHAFWSQGANCPVSAEFHKSNAERYEAMHADWVARMSDIIGGRA